MVAMASGKRERTPEQRARAEQAERLKWAWINAWSLRSHSFTPTQALIGFHMALMANPERDLACVMWPGAQTLGNRVGLKPEAARLARKALEDAGVIRLVQRGYRSKDGQKSITSRYVLVHPSKWPATLVPLADKLAEPEPLDDGELAVLQELVREPEPSPIKVPAPARRGRTVGTRPHVPAAGRGVPTSKRGRESN